MHNPRNCPTCLASKIRPIYFSVIQLSNTDKNYRKPCSRPKNKDPSQATARLGSVDTINPPHMVAEHQSGGRYTPCQLVIMFSRQMAGPALCTVADVRAVAIATPVDANNGVNAPAFRD